MSRSLARFQREAFGWYGAKARIVQLMPDTHREHVSKPSANHAPGACRHATELIWSNRPLAAEITLFGHSAPCPYQDTLEQPGDFARGRP